MNESDRLDVDRGRASSVARLAFFVLIAAGATSQASARIPCSSVVREIHRAERGGGRTATAELIAKSLGTSTAWVERCAETYGRRLKTGDVNSERREAHERAWESQEEEEVGHEERETADDVVVEAVPRHLDKRRQRGFHANEQDWEPYEHRPWEPNTGRQWSPYIDDPYRTEPDDLEGVVRD